VPPRQEVAGHRHRPRHIHQEAPDLDQQAKVAAAQLGMPALVPVSGLTGPIRLPQHFLADRPWRSGPGCLLHAALDAAADAALARDRDGGRPPTSAELEDWRMSGGPRVLLAVLSQRGTVNLRRDRLPTSGKAATGSA
jgi:hypothetical protein